MKRSQIESAGQLRLPPLGLRERQCRVKADKAAEHWIQAFDPVAERPDKGEGIEIARPIGSADLND